MHNERYRRQHIFGRGTVMSAATQPSYADDRAEIENLMARYLFAIDWNDFDAYAQMFTEDGELDYASGTAKGRDNVVETVKGFKERIGKFYVDADGNPAVLRHIIAQTVIRVEGDEAWATAFWYEMANNGPEGKPKVGTFGTYEDTLRRVDGRWLFSRRRINNEFLEGRGSGAVNPARKMDELADAATR